MSDFDFWTWFVILTGGGFAFWETAAIVGGHREWTFTYRIRTWLGIEHPKPWRVPASIAFAVAMVGFTVWFVPHIVFGWWGGAP